MVPVWKRPEILKLFVKSFERLREYADLELLCILSPDDPYYFDHMEILPKRTYMISHKNYPFGKKKNFGGEFAKNLKWDYLLELNSDSIVNPKIFELYRPFMEKKTPFFGLNNLYVVDYYTQKSIFIPNYNTDMTFGAGQMLHKDAYICKLWTDELNEGIDTSKISHLRRAGIDETVVDCGEVPMVVDIKTHTTITHFIELEARSEKQVDYEFLKMHIGYDFIN
jgi:hypothetical protein